MGPGREGSAAGVHLAELLLLHQGIDLGVGLLEGGEGFGEDGILRATGGERKNRVRSGERTEGKREKEGRGVHRSFAMFSLLVGWAFLGVVFVMGRPWAGAVGYHNTRGSAANTARRGMGAWIG